MTKNLVFYSLNRISGFAEDTHARKNSNKIWFFTHLIVSLQQNIMYKIIYSPKAESVPMTIRFTYNFK